MGKEQQHHLEGKQDGVYIIKNGTVKPLSGPPSGYGKTVISWEANKPTRAEHQYSEKL